MSISLNVQLTEVGGRIDQDAARASFESGLAKLLAEREVEQTQIAQVVSDLFDRQLGQGLKMPYLGSTAANALNAQPENFSVLSERVLDYVRANSQGDGKTKPIDETSLFVIAKGKNGGAFRRADMPKKA